MATVNKDFKIKSGLVVEGTTGTINGQDILTKKQADQDYIVSLIGGTATSANTPDTVVKRDGSGNFAANVITTDTIYVGNSTQHGLGINGTSTELGSDNGIVLSAGDDITLNSGNGDIVLNPDGNSFLWSKSSANQISTQGYVDGEISSLDTAAQGYATAAENNAKGYADSLAPNYDAAGSASSAQSAAQLYADGVAGDAYTNAVSDAASDATTKANNALSDANDYTDSAISTEVSDRNSAISTAITNLDLSNTYDAKGDAAQALADANTYTDGKVSDLVDSAPDLLNTLNELAAAIADNPNYATDVASAVSGRVAKSGDTMTGDLVLPGAPTLDLHASTKKYVDDQAYLADMSARGYADGVAGTAYTNAVADAASDATTKATNAYNDAVTYANGLAVNYDAAGSAVSEAGAALSSANSYTDTAISTEVTNRNTAITDAVNALDTDAIEEGATNQYFTDYRAKTSAVDLLVNASKSNIDISWTNQGGLVIEAENGVADSTTDNLAEGSTNLYFQDSRALDAVSGSNIQPASVDITWVRREEATWTGVPTASTATVHSFGTNKGSAKYLVRVISGSFSHVTEILATTDASNNVAVVEYGTIYTSEDPLATATVVWDAGSSQYNLNVTTANNNSEVLVAATLLSYND
jgi:hypothetical protein